MKRKLAGFGLLFAVAELAGATLPLKALWVAAAVLCAAWLVLFLQNRKRRKVRWCRPLLLGLVAGLAWTTFFQVVRVRPVQALADQTVTATATVEPGAEAAYESGMLRGSLRLTDIEGYRGSLLVHCQSFPASRAGERFTAQFTLRAVAEDEYKLSRYADGIWLEAEFSGRYSSLPPARGLRYRLQDFRDALRRRLYTWTPPVYAGLETAMLLGDRSALDDTVYRAFQQAGVAHLLAVSGLHVTLLCGLLTPSFTEERRRFSRLGTLLGMAVVGFYMALTGFTVSVVRAGTIFLIAQVGRWFHQPSDTLTSLGAAAILLGLFNAFAPCDLGFQLSFCAVLGVVAAGALAKAERGAVIRRTGAELPWPWRALLAVAEALQVTLCASVATLPVLVARGMAVSGVAMLTNLLVVWMLRPALLLGLLVLALSSLPVFSPAMRMASLILTLWLRAMLSLVRFCAALPLARLDLPQRYTLWVLAVLGLLILVFWLRRKHGSLAWFVPAVAVCGVLAVALGIWARQDVATIALVGTGGNPCAVLTQQGHAAVFYRGGAYNASEVSDYLDAHGSPVPDLFIDLRRQPDSVDLQATTKVTAQEAPPRSDYPFGEEIEIVLYHQSNANVCVIDMGGIRAAIQVGSPEFDAPIRVNLFCAGGAKPACLEPDVVLTNSRSLRWLPDLENSKIYYGGTAPCAVVRPGKSLAFEGVSRLALQ